MLCKRSCGEFLHQPVVSEQRKMAIFRATRKRQEIAAVFLPMNCACAKVISVACNELPAISSMMDIRRQEIACRLSIKCLSQATRSRSACATLYTIASRQNDNSPYMQARKLMRFPTSVPIQTRRLFLRHISCHSPGSHYTSNKSKHHQKSHRKPSSDLTGSVSKALGQHLEVVVQLHVVKNRSQCNFWISSGLLAIILCFSD